jgi:hypothetical protein
MDAGYFRGKAAEGVVDVNLELSQRLLETFRTIVGKHYCTFQALWIMISTISSKFLKI